MVEPNLYKEFYLTTPAAEKELGNLLQNYPEQVVACKKRLAELEELLKHDENRCSTSKVQRNFLRRMLAPYQN